MPDLLFRVPETGPALSIVTGTIDWSLWNVQHPYVFAMSNDTGEWFYRLRGLGIINDPNDFAQLLVSVIPLMFVFWRAKKLLFNVACVILPVCVLLIAVFTTHSRGALIALVAVALVAAWRRIGLVPALLLATALFGASVALQFAGGREISADSGADRTELWSESLQLLKSHPLFGVGAGRISDYLGLTAHNSVMVCAAELGLFGLFFWSMFLLSTMRDTLLVASPGKTAEGGPIAAEQELFPKSVTGAEIVEKSDINRMGRLLLLSLTGFLVAGIFLSRAFTTTFFVLGGMTEVVYQLALERGMIGPRIKLSRLFPYSGGLALSLVVLMYVIVRILNLVH